MSQQPTFGFNFMPDERERELEAAPGLTVADIDRMLREHYVAGERAGRARGYQEGHESGRVAGGADARERIRGGIDTIIRGQLNHIARRLNDRLQHPKSTIARERDFAFKAGEDLHRALLELERLK